MKKIIFLAVFLLLLATLPKAAVAQSTDTNSQSNQMHQQMLIMIQSKVGNQKSTATAHLQQVKINLIMQYWTALKNTFQNAIDKLNDLVARIDSRIAKIEAQDPSLNLSSVKQDLESSKNMLADAKAKLEAADQTMPDVLNSNDPKTAFLIVRNTVKDIKTELLNVRKNLVSIIGKIKGLHVGENPTVTAAPSISL